MNLEDHRYYVMQLEVVLQLEPKIDAYMDVDGLLYQYFYLWHNTNEYGSINSLKVVSKHNKKGQNMLVILMPRSIFTRYNNEQLPVNQTITIGRYT